MREPTKFRGISVLSFTGQLHSLAKTGLVHQGLLGRLKTDMKCSTASEKFMSGVWVIMSVCASNGETYSSKCEMRKAGCRLQSKLQVIVRGSCQRPADPCSTAKCSRSQVCILDPADARRPKCICNHQCSRSINYVCGTNHQSYTSPCHLHKRACEEQTNVTVLHDGLCSLRPNPSGNDVPSTEESSIDSPAGIDPCELVVNTCPTNKRCVVDEAGEATCVCKTSCSNTEGARVCGSDGETYFNECRMRIQACHLSRDITIANMGTCRSELCKSLNCHRHGHCETNPATGLERCSCTRDCPAGNGSVCGESSLGRELYRSQCAMEKLACQLNEDIAVVPMDRCGSAMNTRRTATAIDTLHRNSVTNFIAPQSRRTTAGDPCSSLLHVCPANKRCIVDEGEARCICKTTCPNEAASVCGSDGLTYLNECWMRVQACIGNLNVTVVKRASCNSVVSCKVPSPPRHGLVGKGEESFTHNERLSISCSNGYRLNGANSVVCGADGQPSMINGTPTCEDIDECTAGGHNCTAMASCNNTIGSFECLCKNGYYGKGTACEECQFIDSIIFNVASIDKASGKVTCAAGFTRVGGTGTASCPKNSSTGQWMNVGSCQALCSLPTIIDGTVDGTRVMASGSNAQLYLRAVYNCNHGYRLSRGMSNTYIQCSVVDGIADFHSAPTCMDIDECTAGGHGCTAMASCKNTIGSFECLCKNGYYGKGTACEECQFIHSIIFNVANIDKASGKVTCAAGFTRVGGTGTASCPRNSSTGLWMNVGSCQALCSPPTIIDGSVDGTRVLASGSNAQLYLRAVYSCNHGYRLSRGMSNTSIQCSVVDGIADFHSAPTCMDEKVLPSLMFLLPPEHAV
ncbi:agrin-like [Sycon ciliatum]|uniref:agrin-like n=1 Tax=Sycon ciliatum TaxID=27933 RepID=UPI0031F6A01E